MSMYDYYDRVPCTTCRDFLDLWITLGRYGDALYLMEFMMARAKLDWDDIHPADLEEYFEVQELYYGLKCRIDYLKTEPLACQDHYTDLERR